MTIWREPLEGGNSAGLARTSFAPRDVDEEEEEVARFRIMGSGSTALCLPLPVLTVPDRDASAFVVLVEAFASVLTEAEVPA